MNPAAIILFLAGLFMLAGAGLDWNWFMEHRRAVFLSKLLGGRGRARVFYIVVGLVCTIAGALDIVGAINLS